MNNLYKTSLVVVATLTVLPVNVQDGKKPKVDVKLSATLASNFYSSRGIEPRQPGNMQYEIVRVNVSLW